jgi:serine/threonine protein phosphatase PrpC
VPPGCTSANLGWLYDILRGTERTTFCTALFGHAVANADGGTDVRFANAGHSAPLKIGQHDVSVIEEHGALLGVMHPYIPPPVIEVHLEPGEQLLLYTDGLLESLEPRQSTHEFADLSLSRSGSVLDIIDGLIDDAVGAARPSRDDIAALLLTAR